METQQLYLGYGLHILYGLITVWQSMCMLVQNPSSCYVFMPCAFDWLPFWPFISRTKKLGPILKAVVLVSLPVPLVLWPVFGIVGSLLGGIGYGFFVPLLATFEAVGGNVTDKFYHCFLVSFSFCLLLCFRFSGLAFFTEIHVHVLLELLTTSMTKPFGPNYI